MILVLDALKTLEDFKNKCREIMRERCEPWREDLVVDVTRDEWKKEGRSVVVCQIAENVPSIINTVHIAVLDSGQSSQPPLG